MSITVHSGGELALRRANRVQVLRMVDLVVQRPQLGPADCTVRHIFAPGNYAREITMPAGVVVVGKIHKHAHLNFIERGHVQVFTEASGLEEYIGPCSFVSKHTTQRVVHVIEETVWTTVHPTNSTSLEEIEREVIADSYEGL